MNFVLWRMYFWLLLTLNAAAVVYELIWINAGGTVDILHTFEWLISLIPLIGLFGYSYRVKIFSSMVWKIVLLAYLFGIVVYTVSAEPNIMDLSRNEFAFLVFFILGFELPLAAALYYYAFRDKEIWEAG